MDTKGATNHSKSNAEHLESTGTPAFDQHQHDVKWTQAVKENPKSIAWCCYMLFTCVLWGYDGLAGSIVISVARFRQDYGNEFQGQWVIPANWQMGFTGASLAAMALGGVITGQLAKRWGRQPCMTLAYLMTIGGAVIQWFSVGSLPMFLGSKIITGVPLGIFMTTAPTYISEVAPLAIRGAFVSGVNGSIVLGQLLAYAVMRETQSKDSSRAYQIIFAVQWGFALTGLAILPFFPESPFFFVSKGRMDKARSNVARLHSSNFDIDGYVSEICTALEKQENSSLEQGGIKECFNAKNRLRTTIALSVFFIQSNTGVLWVVAYMSYFLALGGMPATQTFDVSVGINGLMLAGTMVGWFLVEYVGRRNATLYGCMIMTVTLFVIGICSVIPSSSAITAQAAFMAIWGFVYQASIGSIGWAFVAEVPSSNVRGITQSLATVMNGASNAVWSFALPYMINPDEANLGGKIAFIFGALLLFCDVFIFFYYPETKGRSFEEIDELFERGISLRKFKETNLVALGELDVKEKV